MRLGKIAVRLLGPALLALFIATMVMVTYANSLKVGAPWLCPDDRPDAFVVRYDVQTSDGTGTNFTLFCMSERGEIYEVGTWKPLLALFALIASGIYLALLLLLVSRIVRRAVSGRGPGRGPPGVDAASPDDEFRAVLEQQGPIIT